MKFDPDQQIVIEFNILDYIMRRVMFQYDKSSILYPVAYFFKKHLSAEYNYEIYNKELIAVIQCYEAYKLELESSAFLIYVLNNYKNLEYFIISKTLQSCQAKWNEYLSRFNFKIVYKAKKINKIENLLIN